MIEPLKTTLLRLILDGIKYDRLGGSTGTGNTGSSHFQTDATLKGVISSFVEVEEYKKKGNLEVNFIAFNGHLFSRLTLSHRHYPAVKVMNIIHLVNEYGYFPSSTALKQPLQERAAY